MEDKKKEEKVKNTGLEPINSPVDIGKKNLLDLINEKGYLLSKANFINSISIPYSDEYNLPNETKFLHDVRNCIYSVTNNFKSNSLNFKKITNFIFTDIKEVIRYENKLLGKQKNTRYYIVTLKNEKGTEVEVELEGDTKSDLKKFCSILDEKANGFLIECKKNEFREIFAKYISVDVACKIKIFTNAGIIGDKEFLYGNALFTNGEILWEKDGYIQVKEDTYYKLNSKASFIPKLAKSSKTGSQITKEFLENIYECWGNNYFLPMVTIGHMVMSVFFKDFVKIGVPTLILFGKSGTGKSTIEKCGLFIFGFTRDAIVSGGSTIKSIEHTSSQYNAVIICIDDIKGPTLVTGNFTELIKSIYNGTARTKMTNFGKEIEVSQVCSPLAGSTNDKLPNLKEVQNRINIIEMFEETFDSNKFKYFEIKGENVEELSLILPEILKFDIKEVISIYKENLQFLENYVRDTQKRVINNIAYAYTGVKLLLKVAGINFNDIESKLLNYAGSQVERYEQVLDVVDKVLAEIPVLYRLGQLEEDVLFTFSKNQASDGTYENVVCFHKASLISKINQCNSSDKSKYIDIDMFNAYYKTHSRYRGNKTVRYRGYINYSGDSIKDNTQNSVMFNIDGLDDYSFFYGVKDINTSQSLNNGREKSPF